jgi:hypothetical protein
MTTKRMQSLISRMHNELNHLIESCNYDLSNEEVIKYSQKFDKVILTYNKALESERRLNRTSFRKIWIKPGC